MKHYFVHVKQHPNTLLSRIIGLHRVKLPHGKKIHFVVMGNIFPLSKDVHEIYDLKVIWFFYDLLKKNMYCF